VDEAQEALQELEWSFGFLVVFHVSWELVVGRIQAFLIMMDHWEFDSQRYLGLNPMFLLVFYDADCFDLSQIK